MKELILKIYRNPGVRKAALALLLAIAAAAGLNATGCAGVQTKADQVRAGGDCRVAVLEPYLGDQAERVLIDAAAGNLNLLQVLLSLDLTPADLLAVTRDFNACSEPTE